MAKPIRIVRKHEPTPEERQQQSMHELAQSLTENQAAVQQSLQLVRELHDSGALELVTALLQSREQVAKIAVSQLQKPAMTNTINNVMEVAGAIGQLNTDATKKVMSGVVNGMERAADVLEKDEKIGIFELVKALRDPAVNRALSLAIGFLKGFGEKI
ncbi:DUF1641 domain-containing protein [Tumebacillus flagellatus]|uniref:DUF1641 domain-containing protein n=1 Tax=Tumebacillus flagellatus TaxID=1157490 RepID=UPI000571B786|nr:DUF1641 domain-containing protein [Tumebacillus flagellatus]